MENIYRLKKRMVYPEQLALDSIVKKSTTTASWCGESLETVTYSSTLENGNVRSRSSQIEDRPSTTTGQFIRERIRHLVDAFSNRTNLIRKRLDLPPTPSSLSSLDEVDQVGRTTPGASHRSSTANAISPDVTVKKQNFCLETHCTIFARTLDPQSNGCMAWLAIAALAYLYNCWTVPLRATFPYQTPTNRPIWMFFDYLSDAVYILDIVLVQPRIKYVSEGFWVTDPALTRKNYVKSSYFKRDLASLIPLDFMYFYLGPDAVYLRTPRLLKYHTFGSFFENIDRILSSPHMIRIFRTLMYMMYLIHLNACAYYAFSAWEGIGSNDFVFNGRGNAYIVCFYFATKTATSIGKNPKPKKEFEFMFMTFSWLMGVFVFALLIGQIRDIIATATRSQTEYRKLVDDTLEYLRRLNMPPDLLKRVQMWFTYTWETQHTLDENSIMDCLPHKMKTDIAINVHIATLNKVTLFADCDEALLRELVLKLRSVIYLPGDLVCRKGEVGHEMYILQSGCVEVVGPDDTVLATLSEGSVFGEISLLGIAGMNRRTADVRSKGYSNLFVLNKSELNEALIHYPDAQEILNKKAKALMRKNASLERARNKPVIVIDNPRAPAETRLLETVMQAVPEGHEAGRLLRYGSKGKPKKRVTEELLKNCSPEMVRDEMTKDETEGHKTERCKSEQDEIEDKINRDEMERGEMKKDELESSEKEDKTKKDETEEVKESESDKNEMMIDQMVDEENTEEFSEEIEEKRRLTNNKDGKICKASDKQIGELKCGDEAIEMMKKGEDTCDDDNKFECDVTVHREMS